MLQQLPDDGKNNTADDSEEPELLDTEILDGYGEELLLDDDGNGSSLQPSEDTDNSVFFIDNALDNSAILADLSGDIALPFPFTAAQPSPQHSSHDILFLPPPSKKESLQCSSEQGHFANLQATGMQELLVAEDGLVTAIKNLLLAGTDPSPRYTY
jgi:hypothetical protein